MINALRMTFLHGMNYEIVLCDLQHRQWSKELCVLRWLFMCRRELLWPELDQLLRNEDDVAGASTPYTAAIPEYRVVLINTEDSAHVEKSWNFTNGHAVYDIQHPCRY